MRRKQNMKSKVSKTLPQTHHLISNGGLYLQRRKCGKKNCKCARGESHSGYYFFTRIKGKLIKQYVRKSEVESFSKIVEQSVFERRQKSQSVKTSTELLKEFRAYLWRNDGLIKTMRQS